MYSLSDENFCFPHQTFTLKFDNSLLCILEFQFLKIYTDACNIKSTNGLSSIYKLC